MTNQEKIEAAYLKGFRDGLASHAIWIDGKQYVGDPRRPLKEAQDQATRDWNYAPPNPGY